MNEALKWELKCMFLYFYILNQSHAVSYLLVLRLVFCTAIFHHRYTVGTFHTAFQSNANDHKISLWVLFSSVYFISALPLTFHFCESLSNSIKTCLLAVLNDIRQQGKNVVVDVSQRWQP